MTCVLSVKWLHLVNVVLTLSIHKLQSSFECCYVPLKLTVFIHVVMFPFNATVNKRLKERFGFFFVSVLAVLKGIKQGF